jgi:iron complex outermembrane receptor protein
MSERTNTLFSSVARTAARLLPVFLLLVSLSRPGLGLPSNDEKSGIHGRVVDPQGIRLPGVTVTIKGDDTAQSAVTDAEGTYRFVLPPGRYTVSGQLPGFSAFERTGVEVRTGQSVNLDIQLGVAPVNESITVLGEEVTRVRDSVEKLQDVPISVSIVTGKELARLEATDISALTQRAANVSWNFGNQRTSSLSIRGVGKQGQTEAQDPSVGVIVDGVNYAYNALTSSYDFTDVDTLEVTRGPQGTLLGKNTTLGVVNVTTKRPSFTQTADASLTFGQWRTALAQFALGGPINNKVAWRGTFSLSKGNGDMKNIYNKDITYTNKDRASGRIQFLWLPTSHFSARISGNLQPRGGETYNGRTINTPTPAFYANGSVNPLTTDASTRLARGWFTQESNYTYQGNYLYGGGQNVVDNNDQRPLVTGSEGVSTELSWVVGPYTLTSITAFQSYHFDASNDEGTPFDILRNSGGFWNDYKQFSEELRVGSSIRKIGNFQAGLFLMKVINDVDYRKLWGNDAGAWFATPTQYNQLSTDSNGLYLMQESLSGLYMAYNSPAGLQHIINKSGAPFAQANWHLSHKLTLTTGARLTWENRQNLGSAFIRDNGYAGLGLNPVTLNGAQLGGFATDSSGNLTAANSTTQLQLADATANKYFGTTITSVAGAAYNGLTAAQRLQVADAKAVRAAQIGVVFNPAQAQPFKAAQPNFVFSPLYKFNDSLSGYVSWQYGQKAGIAQFTNGISNLTTAERNNAYEVGIKSVLGRTLLLNGDVFTTGIRNYQQSVQAYDAYTTALSNDGTLHYTSATGNVPKVRVKGVELDGVYAGLANTSVRFAGAFNDARYKYFPNSGQPVENGYVGAPPYRDVSGQTLPGASKWTFNVAPDYRIRTSEDHEIHITLNTAFTSRYKYDVALSDYSWIPAHSVTDLAIGFGKRDQRFVTSFLVKNLFNDRSPQTQTWNSYTPAVPRWFGVMFTGKMF